MKDLSHLVSETLVSVIFLTDLLADFACEPDEYAALVQELKESGLIKDHRRGLTVYKKSFTGKEFVNWIVKNKQLGKH